MAIAFRGWREGDDLALNEIWGDPETFQAGQFRGALAASSGGTVASGGAGAGAADGGPWRRCIVAEDVVDSVAIPVAAAVVYETSLHATRLWAYVEVAKDHRRAGLGATLVTMLRREAERAPSAVHALRCKVEPDTAGAAFAGAMGLHGIQRSRMVVVAPGLLPLPRFGNGDDESAAAAVQDLATGSVELTDVVGRYYEAIHGWDPTGALSAGTVQRLFLDDLAGAHGAVVLRTPPESAFGRDVPAGRKGPIRSFAVSYQPPETGAGDAAGPSEVFLGHEPALAGGDAEAAIRDLLALIAYQHPVLLELDDAMEAVAAVVGPLLEAGQARQLGAETLVVAD
ncbi:MAG: hypothetical protein ACHP7K_07980 [Actinomycetales bacterium]